MTPSVSVLCPTFNRGKAIVSTIRSVQAQTVDDWELIVVSDGSTDGTDDIVKELANGDPRIRLHRTKRYGHPSGPCNEGAKLAGASVHAYLAHDDHWEPRHLEVLTGALDRSSTHLAYGRAVREDTVGNELSTTEWLMQLWHPDIQTVHVGFEPVRAVWDAQAVAAVGGWRESPDGLEDWDLWYRLAQAGYRFVPVKDVTARIFEGAQTRKHSLACPYDVPLARFETSREARAAVRALTDRRVTAAFLEAYQRDTTNWYVQLLENDELALPDGWAVTSSDIESAVEDVVRPETKVWEMLRITQHDDGWQVGSVAATQTKEHADRIIGVIAAHMPELSTRVEEVTGKSLGHAKVPAKIVSSDVVSGVAP